MDMKKVVGIIMSLMILFGGVLYVYAASPINSTINGEGTKTVTGDAYPTSVVHIGNTGTTAMRFNAAFETTQAVGAAETAEFTYNMYIYDGSGIMLGSRLAQTATGSVGAQTAIASNVSIPVSSIPTGYVSVVEVINLSIS